MTFATLYSIRKVLMGILIGTAVNHSLAVILGVFIGNILEFEIIQIFASSIFIVFGILTLKEDLSIEKLERKKIFINPIMTIAVVFFISELGDKTQLATFTLASESSFPIYLILGTISGMIFASLFGIFIGKILGDRLPEKVIILTSASVFYFLGIYKAYSILENSIVFYSIFLITVFIYFYLVIKKISYSEVLLSEYKKISLDLYVYNKNLLETIDDFCLTEEICNHCKGKACLMGQIKYILKNNEEVDVKITDKDKFPTDQITFLLSKILFTLMMNTEDKDKVKIYNFIRIRLEKILFENVYVFNSIEEYLNIIKKDDFKKYNMIINFINEEIEVNM